MKNDHLSLLRCGLVAAVFGATVYSNVANADVTLLKEGQGSSFFNPLSLSIGGRAELGFQNQMGGADHGSVTHRGWADDSDYHADATYRLNDDWSLLGYYEMTASWFKALGWNHHTYRNRGGDDTYTRQLYVGIANEKWGTLTYGKQWNAYYPAVASKPDIWVNDNGAVGPSNGIDGQGSYDGSYRAKNMINYKNTFGPVTLYTTVALPATAYYLHSEGINRYKRRGGGAIGINYQITNDLAWGLAYSNIKANLYSEDGHTNTYHQQMTGTGFSWAPGHWKFAGSLGYFTDFVPNHRYNSAHNYFSHSAYGYEYYAGYTIPVQSSVLKAVLPYVAGASMHGQKFSTNDQFIGLSTTLAYNTNIIIEHQFAHSSGMDKADHPSATHIRLIYNF